MISQTLEMACPTPTKKKYKSRLTAGRGAVVALTVFQMKQADFYKCICGKWHFTTKRDGMTEKEKRHLQNARNIRKFFGTNRAKPR